MSVLGFESWQCLAALTHAQGNLHQAAACLLGGHLDTPAQAQRLLSQPDVERALLAEEQASHLDQLQQAQVRTMPSGGTRCTGAHVASMAMQVHAHDPCTCSRCRTVLQQPARMGRIETASNGMA